jgi:hypothetical protein
VNLWTADVDRVLALAAGAPPPVRAALMRLYVYLYDSGAAAGSSASRAP